MTPGSSIKQASTAKAIATVAAVDYFLELWSLQSTQPGRLSWVIRCVGCTHVAGMSGPFADLTPRYCSLLPPKTVIRGPYSLMQDKPRFSCFRPLEQRSHHCAADSHPPAPWPGDSSGSCSLPTYILHGVPVGSVIPFPLLGLI